MVVPAGSTGTASAKLSTEAWLVSAILFGFNVEGLVAKAAGSALGAAAKHASDRLAVLSLTVPSPSAKTLKAKRSPSERSRKLVGMARQAVEQGASE